MKDRGATREARTEADFQRRELEMKAEDRDRGKAEEEARKNHGFVQVYAKGWSMLESLMKVSPGAAQLYVLLAKNVDERFGCVIVSQPHLAEILGVSERYVRECAAFLESLNAIKRFRAAGSTAYCLDPLQVWRGTNNGKDTAMFHTNVMLSRNEQKAFKVKMLGAVGPKSAHQQMKKAAVKAKKTDRKAKQAPTASAMPDPGQLSMLDAIGMAKADQDAAAEAAA
ncbi:MAG TPA: hypothetical protein HPQ04_03990 [Rhodospirillaceae bacterium]|nr:hypothetical protein [Rhodospirillaceae bacterium]